MKTKTIAVGKRGNEHGINHDMKKCFNMAYDIVRSLSTRFFDLLPSKLAVRRAIRRVNSNKREGIKMRKVFVPISVAILGWLLLQSVPHVLAQLAYPPDLAITAISGGFAPWETCEKIEIASTGYTTYWRMTNRTAAEWILNSSFTLSVDDLSTIWNAIETNNFFGLAPHYTEPNVLDGSFCVMSIIANNQTHTVRTENIEVPEFDAVAITINNVTPGDLDLFYNQIHPDHRSIEEMAAHTSVKTSKQVATTILLPSAILYGTLMCGTMFLCLQGGKKMIRKIHHRCSSYSIQVLTVVLVLIILSVNSVAADTRVTSTKCHITVDVYIEFYTSLVKPEVLQELVNRWKEGVEDMWNIEYKWCGLCIVTFDVHTKIRQPGNPWTSGYHHIYVLCTLGRPYTSWTDRRATFDTTTGKTGDRVGVWDDLDWPEVAAHEAGHLMGRPDTYDRTTGRPLLGYENDIMARTRPPVPPIEPYEEHIKGIVRDSGQIPPPFATAAPKTIVICIPDVGRNTGAFSITISNPKDQVISVSMDFKWTGPTPEDTVVGVLTGFVDVDPHDSEIVNLPSLSVGLIAKAGTFPCEITWRDQYTGKTFTTDPTLILTKILGDLDLNGIVDIFDVVKVAIAFGSKLGDPNWNPAADVKNDGEIDIFDVVTVSKNFGKEDC